MEWSRIKTIILIILAVTNVSLLGFLVQRELQVQNARQEARQNSIQFLENNGVTVEDETVPEEMTLLPQTVEWDREQEREAASVLLGARCRSRPGAMRSTAITTRRGASSSTGTAPSRGVCGGPSSWRGRAPPRTASRFWRS